jgi:hypothetical protein
MEKASFIDLLNHFIIPLFTGSEIIGEEPSSNRDAPVAQGDNGTIIVKPTKNDEYRIIIKRDQPFKKFEIELVKAVLEELKNVNRYQIQEPAYNKILYEYALEKAVCRSINERNYQTLLDLLFDLDSWANRTYEGSNTCFGFIMSPKIVKQEIDGETKISFSKMLSEDFSALLSDGINSCIFVDGAGNILGHIPLHNINNEDIMAPYFLIDMANACKNGRIGVSLLRDGNLLIFSKQEIVFAKRRGEWNSYSHEEIIEKVAPKEYLEELRKAAYLTALDVSFTGTGGCLAIVRDDQEYNVLKHINIDDILLESYYLNKIRMNDNISNLDANNNLPNTIVPYKEYIKQDKCVKVLSLRKMINGRKFQELDRKFRAELLGIDGATIIDHEGNIIAVGAIIQIAAGSTGGGRLAASKTLAQYGNSLKISMDGTIQGFTFDSKKQRVKSIFTI